MYLWVVGSLGGWSLVAGAAAGVRAGIIEGEGVCRGVLEVLLGLPFWASREFHAICLLGHGWSELGVLHGSEDRTFSYHGFLLPAEIVRMNASDREPIASVGEAFVLGLAHEVKLDAVLFQGSRMRVALPWQPEEEYRVVPS